MTTNLHSKLISSCSLVLKASGKRKLQKVSSADHIAGHADNSNSSQPLPPKYDYERVRRYRIRSKKRHEALVTLCRNLAVAMGLDAKTSCQELIIEQANRLGFVVDPLTMEVGLRPQITAEEAQQMQVSPSQAPPFCKGRSGASEQSPQATSSKLAPAQHAPSTLFSAAEFELGLATFQEPSSSGLFLNDQIAREEGTIDALDHEQMSPAAMKAQMQAHLATLKDNRYKPMLQEVGNQLLSDKVLLATTFAKLYHCDSRTVARKVAGQFSRSVVVQLVGGAFVMKGGWVKDDLFLESLQTELKKNCRYEGSH